MKKMFYLRIAGLASALLMGFLAGAAEETRYNGMKYFGAPQDWISVRLDGYPAEELPAVYADGTMRKVVVRHEVPNIRDVHGPKGFPFLLTDGGELTVRLRSWDGSLVRTLQDAISGGTSGLGLSLGDYGYRVFTTGD